MSPRPRVVVTGIGAVCTWGWGTGALWTGLASGRHGMARLARFAPDGYATSLAGEVPPVPGSRRRCCGSVSRSTYAERFAVAAAVEAAERAGLGAEPRELDGDVALYFGSSTGGMFESEELYRTRAGRPLAALDPRGLAAQQVSAPGEAVARRLRITGPVETVSSACSSATLACRAALDAVRRGTVALALAGGSDSLCRVTYGGFNALRAIDERPSRPFRADRAGLSLGEGAAVLVLETAEHALARGATPLAELAGAGASSDAHHMTAPDPDGAGPALALERALADAGITAGDVDFVNAHGTGTELNDLAEHRALERVFGARAREIPLSVTKASVGHLLGSAGAIEAVATVISLLEGRLPPTPGGGEVDPRTPVTLAGAADAPARVPRTAVSLNLAFGGCNAALVLARLSGEAL